MDSFFDRIPREYHDKLQHAIDAVNETNEFLRQVKARFGTNDHKLLAEKMGQVFDGIEVTENTISELEELSILHQSRREYCQNLMDEIANKPRETAE